MEERPTTWADSAPPGRRPPRWTMPACAALSSAQVRDGEGETGPGGGEVGDGGRHSDWPWCVVVRRTAETSNVYIVLDSDKERIHFTNTFCLIIFIY